MKAPQVSWRLEADDKVYGGSFLLPDPLILKSTEDRIVSGEKDHADHVGDRVGYSITRQIRLLHGIDDNEWDEDAVYDRMVAEHERRRGVGR